MNKIINVGLCTIRNEEKYIKDWIEMLSVFCERVVILLDPATTDKTEEIAKQYPIVEIYYQYRSLGDSDEDHQGKDCKLIMHVNKTKWIQENIPDGDWFVEIAADERFNPSDYEMLKSEILHAKKHGFDALVHRRLFEPIICHESQVININNNWFIEPSIKPEGKELNYFIINWSTTYNLTHSRFQKKYKDWKQNDQPHHMFKNKAFNPLYSAVPIWHFHRIKSGVLGSSWRDNKGSIAGIMKLNNGLIPIVPSYIPFDFKYDSYVFIPENFKLPQVSEIPKTSTGELFEIDINKRWGY